MRCLLDSHAFLWFVNGSERLGERARDVITDIDNEILLSAASLWEFAIKISLGKLELEQSLSTFVEGLPILSGDGEFRKYPVQIIW